MDARATAAGLGGWIRSLPIRTTGLSTARAGDAYELSFRARTTATRASSIVTRVGLLAREVCGERESSIWKTCLGRVPAANDELADWAFVVRVQVRPRKNSRAPRTRDVVGW